MATRNNPTWSAFVRGLVLGRLYQKGSPVDYHRIQRLFGVSSATAKRDMRAMRSQGLNPNKPATA